MATDIFEMLDRDIELLTQMNELRAQRKRSLHLLWAQSSLLSESIADMDDFMRGLQQSKTAAIEPEDELVQRLSGLSKQTSANVEAIDKIKTRLLHAPRAYGLGWLVHYGLTLWVIRLQRKLLSKLEAARRFIPEHNADLSARGPIFTDVHELMGYLKKP